MIVAGVWIMSVRKSERHRQTFETSLASLEALLDWLTASDCTLVAMEATGLYLGQQNVLDQGSALAIDDAVA